MKTSGAAVLVIALLAALMLAQATPATGAAPVQSYEDNALLTAAERDQSGREDLSADEPAESWEPGDLEVDQRDMEPPDEDFEEPYPGDEPVMDAPEPMDEGMEPGE